MIYSMTAFARCQQQGDWGSLTCELRSINHRYLEISLSLPDTFRGFEMALREQMRARLKRGKVECTIRYQSHPDANDGVVSINKQYAHTVCRAAEAVAELLLHPGTISPTDILRLPGVLETKDVDLKRLEGVTTELLEQTLTDLLSARAREGEELKNLCLQRMSAITHELSQVMERYPLVIAEQQARLKQRFADVSIELDPQRLEQEMVFFAQKSDIAEEIDRANTHIAEMQRVFKEGGLAGRRLDFLIQELHREANTLGSKSADAQLTHAAVEMKVLIEQMREQVQNIE